MTYMFNLLKSDKYLRHGRPGEMLKVTQNFSPDMSVHINQGTTIYNNKIINIEDQISTDLAAPDIGNWICIISVNTKGQIVYTYGIQSTDVQTFPTLPDECIHLAAVTIAASDTYITNEQIYDLRTIFTFSRTEEVSCKLKCTSDVQTLTEEERKMIVDYTNKYELLAEEIDKLKLELQPKKLYYVLSDSGHKFMVRFKDDGTPYFERVGFIINEDDTNQSADGKTQNYRFTFANTELNVVALDRFAYVPFPVKIRSVDAMNEPVSTTLIVTCVDARIYSENFTPQYRENEFIVDNLTLTKSGFCEHFSFNFHNTGDHVLKAVLYNNNTKEIIDSASALVHVSFVHTGEEHC